MRLLCLFAFSLPLCAQSIFFNANVNTLTAASPTFSPTAGTVSSGTSVTISTATSGCSSSIYWKTSAGVTTSDNHSTSFTVSSTGTWYAKVIGCAGYQNSAEVSAAYTVVVPPSDTFTGSTAELSTHTSDSGHTWTSIGGAIVNLDGSGNAVGNTNGTTFQGMYTSNWTPTSADYTSCVTISSAAVEMVFAVGRYQNVNNYYLGGYNGTALAIRKTVGGTNTTLGTSAGNGNGSEVCLVMAGNQISLTKDGTTIVGPVTDSGVTAAGSAGIALRVGGKATAWRAF